MFEQVPDSGVGPLTGVAKLIILATLGLAFAVRFMGGGGGMSYLLHTLSLFVMAGGSFIAFWFALRGNVKGERGTVIAALAWAASAVCWWFGAAL